MSEENAASTAAASTAAAASNAFAHTGAGPAANVPQANYFDVWSAAALELIQTLSGDGQWTQEQTAVGAPPPPLDMVVHLELTGALTGSQQVKLTRAGAHAWARLLLPAPNAESEPAIGALDEAQRQALTEAMQRLCGVAEKQLEAAGWGTVKVQLVHVGVLRRAVESAERTRAIVFRHPGGAALDLELALQAALRERIRQRMHPGTPAEPVAEGPDRGAAHKLDMLLDVELDVTMRFGGRSMLLHDVVELAPGSVLELDRQIDDPVELLIGSKTIAWGEVVVVDGNYGLRVNRLVHRRERMAAMEAIR